MMDVEKFIKGVFIVVIALIIASVVTCSVIVKEVEERGVESIVDEVWEGPDSVSVTTGVDFQ